MSLIIDKIKKIKKLYHAKGCTFKQIKDAQLELGIAFPEEYIDIVCDQLEYLRPEIVINRITGDPVKEDLIEPTWLIKKFCVLNDIDKEQLRRNSYQGLKFNNKIKK